MQLVSSVFSTTSIRCGLLCLLFLNSLFRSAGGIVLNVHHDFSFHLAHDAHHEEVKSDEHTTGLSLSGGASHHHHHELVLSCDELPVFRINEAPKTQFSQTLVSSLMDGPVFGFRKTTMSTTALSRAPPEVMRGYLAILRTQVLRL